MLAALDRLHTRWPFYGQRKLKVELDKLGLRVNRKRLRRLMDEHAQRFAPQIPVPPRKNAAT